MICHICNNEYRPTFRFNKNQNLLEQLSCDFYPQPSTFIVYNSVVNYYNLFTYYNSELYEIIGTKYNKSTIITNLPKYIITYSSKFIEFDWNKNTSQNIINYMTKILSLHPFT